MKYIWQGMVTYKIAPLPNRNACDPLITGEGTVRANGSQAGSAKIELLHGIIGMSQEPSTGPHFMLNFKCTLNPPAPDLFWSPMYVTGRSEASDDTTQMFPVKDRTYVGQNGVVATKTFRRHLPRGL